MRVVLVRKKKKERPVKEWSFTVQKSIDC